MSFWTQKDAKKPVTPRKIEHHQNREQPYAGIFGQI